MDVAGERDIRKVYRGNRRVEFRYCPVGDLLVRQAALLRFQQRGGQERVKTLTSVSHYFSSRIRIYIQCTSPPMIRISRFSLLLSMSLRLFVSGRKFHTQAIRAQSTGGMSARHRANNARMLDVRLDEADQVPADSEAADRGAR